MTRVKRRWCGPRHWTDTGQRLDRDWADIGGKTELTTNINTNITNIMNQTFRDEKWLNSMASSVQMVGNELIIEGSCIGSVLSQGANLQAPVTASTAMQKPNFSPEEKTSSKG